MPKMLLPYGTWSSPVTPALAAKAGRRFGTVQAAGGAVYWTESRPEEGGRQVIMRAASAKRVEELLPAPFSARSRVHEYGGGEFLVVGETVYFVNFSDQQVYRVAAGRAPARLTSAPQMRFADFAFDAARGRLLAVAEIHPDAPASEHALPRNVLVAIALESETGRVSEIAAGRDFYANPRPSPDGNRLAFLAWDLPDMPWDSAALHLAGVRSDGSLVRAKRIAGGDGGAAFQPEWSADGTLYYVSDATGWGCLYRWRDGKTARVLGARGQELFRPLWVFGARSYALHPDGRIAAVFLDRGMPRVDIRKPGAKAGGKAPGRVLPQGVARVDDPIAAGAGFAALVSQSTAAPAVMRIGSAKPTPVAPGQPLDIASANLSKPRVLEFRGFRRQRVYGLFYPPTSAGFRGPARAAPPAIITVHGGPTSMTDGGLKMRTQFFTSRGFAVFDINYAGSTGYGRAYRSRLDGQWGIADVADCEAAARHLAREGLADAARLAIAGGSAGGYTTLMALATTDVFAAGSSHYGVSDLALLLAHTHKFESGYLHRLMGTTPTKWREVFAARSPINLVDRISVPVILFQGLDDKVVPPEQSRRIRDRLRQRGIDVAYHEFPGEGHGFRSATTIIAVMEAELAFLQRALKLG